MSAAQNNVSPNINLAMETRKTSLPNLSYPIRPVHTPWVESSVPLVVKKTESFRYQTNFVYSNGSSGLVATPNDTSFELPTLKWMQELLTLLKRELRRVKVGITAAYLFVRSS